MSQINFTPIDLSQLPAPNIIEALDFESIKNAIITDYQQRYPKALVLQSDPVIKLIETVAYRELLLRQRINDGANAVLLATATAVELDYLANRFNITRQIISPGDASAIPPIPPVFESDERLRTRVQLSLEGFSTAGPSGAYVFHAMAASPQVKDVSIDAPSFAYAHLSDELRAQLPDNVIVLTCTDDVGLTDPMPGDVVVTTLSTQGTGKDPELAEQVIRKLSDDDVRPLTDHVRNRDVEIIEYNLIAKLYLFYGPDQTSVLDAAKNAVNTYVNAQHKLGRDITQSGLYAALHQAGVQRVELISPSADLNINTAQAAYCTLVNVTIGGRDD